MRRIISPEGVSKCQAHALDAQSDASSVNLIFPEFDEFFCETTHDTEPSENELTSPDLHPVLVKVNSLGGVSESEVHSNIVTTVLNQSAARIPKARPASPHGAPSVP